MIYSKNIAPPSWGNDLIASTSIIQYIKSVESLILSSGLIKSNTADNMDTDNIVLPSINGKTGYNYISKSLQFDLTDEFQVSLPLRIKLYFGFFRNAISKSGTSELPIFLATKISVHDINNESSVIRGSSCYFNGITYQTLKPNVSWQPSNIYNSNTDSFIVNRNGFFAFNINPNYGEWGGDAVAPPRKDNSLFFLVIDRNYDCANVLLHGDDNTLTLNNTIIGATKPPEVRNGNLHFVDTNTLYSGGKIVIFPTFVNKCDDTIIQSSNVCVVSKDVINTGNILDVTVNGVPSKFIAMSGKGDTYFNGSGRIIVRYS